MTSTTNTPRRRAYDRGPVWLQWVRRTFDAYGAELQLAFGVFLLVVASAVFVVALQVKDLSSDADVRSRVAAQTSAQAREQSRASCNRTRLYGPFIVQDFTRREVMPPRVLEAYDASIPKTCP